MSAKPATQSAPEIITFGCRLNAFESEVMRRHAEAAGLGEDIVIINSCAVTSEAERQARQTIRKLRRTRPNAKIIVTGCAAQINKDDFAAMSEVDHVLGNDEKMQAESWARFAQGDAPRMRVNDIMALREAAVHFVPAFDGRSRGFVEIQQGCDHRCTFCIIPFGRGNNRSVPLGGVVEQARQLAAQGYSEIVLTGVDITGYGQDLPGRPTLGQAVRRLLAQAPEIKRLRLSSVDPKEIDEDLIRLAGEEERLMPYWHLSLQAGDDMILKRMKRRHLRQDAIDLCNRLRALRPDITFGADIIAGFPTEDEAMFENSLRIIDECGLTFLHVFPYSSRSGTPAARMPQLPIALRKERAARLRSKGEAAARAWMETQRGHKARILVEDKNQGRTDHYAPAQWQGEAASGSILEGRVTDIREGRLVIAP